MIVVEEKLIQLFDLLPPMRISDDKPEGFKPVYHFGDGIEANEFIKRQGMQVYPLIYQNLTEETDFDREGVYRTTLDIVLAVKTESTVLNDVRWATSYRNILNPLYQNIKSLFRQSGIIDSNFEYRRFKYPNYSSAVQSRDETAFINIVDALRFTLDCTIHDRCINTNIKY